MVDIIKVTFHITIEICVAELASVPAIESGPMKLDANAPSIMTLIPEHITSITCTGTMLKNNLRVIFSSYRVFI